jgi:HSP20 family molecular chaperone IbpA
MHRILKIVGAGAAVLAGVLFLWLCWGSSPAANAGVQNRSSMKEPEVNRMFERLHRQIAKFNETFNSLFDEDFFEKSMNPFAEMDEFREKMRSQFKKLDFGKDISFSDHLFDAWFSHRFGGKFGDIERKEGKDYISYRFKVDDPKKYKFTAKIRNGSIQLSAESKSELEKEQKGYKSQSITEYRFERSFPVPQNVDTNKFSTSVEGNQYIIKFPKTD